MKSGRSKQTEEVRHEIKMQQGGQLKSSAFSRNNHPALHMHGRRVGKKTACANKPVTKCSATGKKPIVPSDFCPINSCTSRAVHLGTTCGPGATILEPRET
jgi:hypothetical protein